MANALAGISDVASLAPELDIDVPQVEALLTYASAMVRAEAGQAWTDDAPDGVAQLVALMVVRALRVPEGVSQETIGNYSVSYAASATDRLYLTKTERSFIRRVAGRGNLFSINTCGTPGYLGVPPEDESTWS